MTEVSVLEYLTCCWRYFDNYANIAFEYTAWLNPLKKNVLYVCKDNVALHVIILVSSLAFYSLHSSGTTAHVLKGSLCFLTLTAWTLVDFYNKAAAGHNKHMLTNIQIINI